MSLDHKLQCHEHIKEKINSARKDCHRLRNFNGKTCGPSPKLIKYAHTSSIRPIITYGAFAFAHKLTAKDETQSIQRQVLMQLGNFPIETPDDASDFITDTPPIDLFLKREMLKCNNIIAPHIDDDWTGYGSKTKL